MTPTSVGLVLVEGQDADGATMDRDSFAVSAGSIKTSAQATAAVLRTEAMAATRGLRLHSIGVTWSEDADAEASMLMRSLSESGFDNVVAIRMPEATEALARGIAEVLGYATTAVCVIEPDAAISLIVNTSDGAVQTAFNHTVDSDAALIAWLSTIFTKADWEPEALVLVGSAGDFEPLIPALEDALSVPVFAPEEATLALARGAALASAQNADTPLDTFDPFDGAGGAAASGSGLHRWEAGPAPRQSALVRVGPAAMLATGLVTFVVSVSIAISLQLAPSRETPSPVPAVGAETPGAVRPARPVMPPPVAIPPIVQEALPEAPPAEATPPEALPPVYEEAPAPIADIPAEAPSVGEVPAAPEIPAADPAPVDPALAPPVVDAPVEGAPPPSVYTPSPVYQSPPPVETKKPGILTRIKEKLTPGPG
ncbi:MAG: hypothetical protein ABW137_36900 [Mycobacterium sp.]